jgi:hypothetical protein
MFKYLKIDRMGVASSSTESSVEMVSPDLIRVQDFSNLGRLWDGQKFVDAPKRYKVWSKTAFVTICGQAVFDAIVDGQSKELRYFKYILDSSVIVDLNIPEYFAMVKLLNDTKVNGVPIMSNAIFAALTEKE